MMMKMITVYGTLTIYKIRDIMKDTQEPIIKYYGAPASFHWIGDIDPELIDEYGLEKTKTFMYNGLPNWAFSSIM